MIKTTGQPICSIGSEVQCGIGRFFAAGVIYSAFAVYLYHPHFKQFKIIQYLFIANVCLASLGSYVLSRRWVTNFAGSFFAGAIYGFGPFSLTLTSYHPVVGFLAASVPWLFLPAAYGPRGKWQWLRIPFSAFPFLAVLLVFQISTYCRLFTMPIQTKPALADLGGLLAPLVMAERGLAIVGFYHVPIAALVIGFSMLLAARRFWIIILLCFGTILPFCVPIFKVSPIIWLTIPLLCGAILVGAGTGGLVSAGSPDRKWVLMSAIITASLCTVTFLLATKYKNTFADLGLRYAKLLIETSRIYLLGTIAVLIIYIMARAKLRVHWLRMALLYFSMAVDIFVSARFIVDKIF